MIKILVFDADGVLINGELFSKKFAKEHKLDIDRITPFFTGPFRDCLIGNADLKEVLVPYLEEWGWKNGVDNFLEYWFSSEHFIDQELVDYIQNYRNNGVKCIIATDQEKYRAEHMFNKIGFINSFDKLYASSYLGHSKISLDFYKKLLNDLGDTKKDEILFWDDSPENITVAREFGINAELYTSFIDFKQKMNDYSFISPQYSFEHHPK